MDIKLFSSMFPTVCKDFSSKNPKKIKKHEIISQLYALKEDKIFAFFNSLSEGCSSTDKEISKKCLKIFPLVYRKFVQKQRAHEFSDILVQRVTKIVDPFIIKSPGRFPEWEMSVDKIEVPSEKAAKKLYKTMTMHLLSDTQVLAQTTIFADASQKEGKSSTYDHNRLGKRAEVFLNASVASYGRDGTFILAGAPLEKRELEQFISELVVRKVPVWVSLHQKGEIPEGVNFFDPQVLASLRLNDGMTIQQTGEKEIAKSLRSTTSNVPRIVIREFSIKKGDETVHSIHLLHYENWINKTPVPDAELLEPLCSAVETKLAEQKIPIVAINCHSGVGRTGFMATLLAARKAVQESKDFVSAPACVRINIPEILYSLQKERAGLGTEKHLIPTFQAFANYAKKINGSEQRVFASTLNSSSSSSLLSSLAH